jgi:hypothetical protein
MHKNSTNQDQLQAYLFARILDRQLALQADTHEAMRHAELEFAETDMSKLEQQLKDSGWSLEYIYLDRKKNRYDVEAERIEKVTPSEMKIESKNNDLKF